MPVQFIDLTNQLLRRINEVEIDQADFASVRGVQAVAKDAINASIQYIYQAEPKWPFLGASTTTPLVVGQETGYAFSASVLEPKWNSFFIVLDDALDEQGRPLEFISRDLWLQQYKREDEISTTVGRQVPLAVFEDKVFGFGVTPSPDQIYTVYYEYWARYVDSTIYTDTSLIQDQYTEVIIQGALYHMYLFRDNPEHAALTKDRFEQQIKMMRQALINKEDTVRTTLVNLTRGNAFMPNQDHF